MMRMNQAIPVPGPGAEGKIPGPSRTFGNRGEDR
jgi:hypothetical protein